MDYFVESPRSFEGGEKEEDVLPIDAMIAKILGGHHKRIEQVLSGQAPGVDERPLWDALKRETTTNGCFALMRKGVLGSKFYQESFEKAFLCAVTIQDHVSCFEEAEYRDAAKADGSIRAIAELIGS